MSTAEVNHVGLTVTDIDAAVEWYAGVFGLTPVFGPVEVRRAGAFEGRVRSGLRRDEAGGVAVRQRCRRGVLRVRRAAHGSSR